MARSFEELRAAMSPERRARNEARTRELVITARFPDGEVEIQQFRDLDEPADDDPTV